MSLNRKLLLAMLVVLVGLGIGYVSLSNWSNARYSQEVAQRLNAMIAQYVVAEEDFFANGTANLDALQHVAQMAMIINPAVEVYLLDTDGRILGHGVPAEQVRLDRVNIEPLEQYLREGGVVRGPVFGDDPRDSESQRVFSVAPVKSDGELAGYLYVVLGGATYQSIAEAVHESHILRVYVAAAVVTTIADTGMGIPNDDLPYIFDRAYKASNSASNLRANAGLRLAIVKKILELHHAPISVHSHVGAGCAFRFELPVTAGQN